MNGNSCKILQLYKVIELAIIIVRAFVRGPYFRFSFKCYLDLHFVNLGKVTLNGLNQYSLVVDNVDLDLDIILTKIDSREFWQKVISF